MPPESVTDYNTILRSIFWIVVLKKDRIEILFYNENNGATSCVIHKLEVYGFND